MPQRLNEIPATIREPAGPEDTPETLEEERKQAQEVIDNGTCAAWFPSTVFTEYDIAAEPLTEDQQQEKEELISQGFEDWSRRDFQQFVRALETYGW